MINKKVMRKKQDFDDTTNDWLNAQAKSTRYNYAAQWRHVQDFTAMTGNQILESRKQDKDNTWETKVLQLKQWMKEQGKGDLSARQVTVVLRSFFAHYRVGLKMTHQESSKLRQGRRKTEDYRFSKDDLKMMAEYGDAEGKYIVVVGKSFGLRAGDFLRLTRGHFATVDHAQTPPIFLCEYPTQKESVNAFPFIDSDAAPIVKALIAKMDREGRISPSERMLQYKNEVELSRVLKRLVDKAGIECGDKQVRFHALRKFLIDRLSDVMSESKWKQIVGKTISEGAYVSPDSLREDYQRAMTETTFTKTEGDQGKVSRREAAVQFLRMLGSTDEEIKDVVRIEKAKIGRELSADEEIQLYEAIAKRKHELQTQTNGGCADGSHCQRVVTETQLEPLLSEGWRVVACLSSGKVVLEH
jgi:integrase